MLVGSFSAELTFDYIIIMVLNEAQGMRDEQQMRFDYCVVLLKSQCYPGLNEQPTVKIRLHEK